MTRYDLNLDFYGANKDAIECTSAEQLLIGPAESGKTLALLWKVNRIAFKYPKASLVILRKTLTSTHSTVLVTFQEKILGPDAPVRVYGGAIARWFDYPNGSRVWVAGLDKSSRVLSASHDFILVNQPEELTLDEWETLSTRTTGRAGHIPHPQLVGDPNPTYPTHWMYKREAITRFYSWHKDNPSLFDPETGEPTAQGVQTMERLASLTGMRRIRLFEGKAVQAEGVVYEGWNEAIHLIDQDQMAAVGSAKRYVCGVDWGYTNPGVIQVWHLDSDDRMYLVHEVYRTKKLIGWWVNKGKEIRDRYKPEAFLCDPSAPENIAEFRRAGLPARKAKNAVSLGIQKVEERLKVQDDGRPRLFIVRDCLEERDPQLERDHKPLCTADEFPSYVWQKPTANRAEKEEPAKIGDHGVDCVRYCVLELDRGRGRPMKTPEKTPSRWGTRTRRGKRSW